MKVSPLYQFIKHLILKKHEYIYYKTDHHWTTNGSYYAYKTFRANIWGLLLLKKDYFNIKDLSNNF